MDRNEDLQRGEVIEGDRRTEHGTNAGADLPGTVAAVPEAVTEPAATSGPSLATWTFDVRRLQSLAEAHAETYRDALPFPHVVLDGLLPDALLDDVLAEFPRPDDAGWRRIDDHFQRKLQWADATAMPPSAAYFVGLLQSSPFVRFLEDLTGVRGLIGDPHLFHAGLHQLEPGGFLKIHSDDLFQRELSLYRRVNVIVYLNRRWDRAWGGDLELWDAPMTRKVRQIEPTFNRMIVFEAQRAANHGHPEATASPAGVTRRSIALYYYTRAENPTTPYGPEQAQLRARPGERLAGPSSPRWRSAIRELSPPIVARAYRGAREAARRRR
jgi:hypothetical protein